MEKIDSRNRISMLWESGLLGPLLKKVCSALFLPFANKQMDLLYFRKF